MASSLIGQNSLFVARLAALLADEHMLYARHGRPIDFRVNMACAYDIHRVLMNQTCSRSVRHVSLLYRTGVGI